MNQLGATREYETKEQMKKRIKTIFDSFDTDHNGSIDKEEFVKGLSSLFNIENLDSAERYKKFFLTIFKMCDTRGWFIFWGDGTLDLGEFERVANAMPLQLTHDIKTNIGTMMFNIIDGDRSGFVDKKEMISFLKNSEFSQIKVGEFIRELDQNSDGKISREEFLYWFKNLDN